MRIGLFLLLSVALWQPAAAQGGRPVFHFPLKLFDLAIIADTSEGVRVLAVPSMATDKGQQGAQVIWLRLDPDSLFEWINRASFAIKQLAPGGPDVAVQWSPALTDHLGRGRLILGRERKGGEWRPEHWLAIADTGTGWRGDLRGREVDSLFRLLFRAATESRLDTSAVRETAPDPSDTPIEILNQPVTHGRGQVGRVLLEYVVTEAGRADPASIVALLASDSDLIEEARQMILSSRFRPATSKGQPVRRSAYQSIVWKPR